MRRLPQLPPPPVRPVTAAGGVVSGVPVVPAAEGADSLPAASRAVVLGVGRGVRRRMESSLHILVDNAGAMGPLPPRTPEGRELHFATNHLGHFALT
ncbi:hypothetical protein [Streptomyces mirabilis]|uniref:hypothetical protein n=1 Tax=Streptomyces mirabilis TaxID=68239 RepID=UPI003BEF2EED